VKRTCRGAHCVCRVPCGAPCAGYVTFEDFFRIMRKKSDNPLEDLDDDEDF